MKIKSWCYSVKELAEYLKMSTQSIYNMVSNKEIPYHQPVRHGKIFFDIAEIDEWLKGKEK